MGYKDGHYHCDDSCIKLRTGVRPNYERGDKFCRRNCGCSFRNFPGNRCPCCNAKLAITSRTRGRNKKHNEYHKRYQMPTEIDFKTMSLPELMIKYPRVRDVY